MQAYTPQAIEALVSVKLDGAPMLIVPYAYPLTFTGLAPAVTATQQLNITANADFLLLGVSYHANVAVGAQNIGNKTVAFARMLVTDSGSNEQFTQAAVDLENFCQNGQDERAMYYPRWIAGRSSLQVSLSNYSAAETYGIELAFNGVLLRAYQQ
jgi:hypothetical protein